VLTGLDLSVAPGETVGLLGANGAGKTTLLQILLGLMPSDSGSASIGGEPSTALSAQARARIGYVPQSPNQFAWLTGGAMLKYIGAFYPRFDWDYTKALIKRWQVSLKTPIAVLSPGQQQRLSIIRALGARPDFLILDEPIAALDPATRIAVIDELTSEHRARGISVLFSSHITADLERLCSRFIVLAQGGIAFDESTARCRNLTRLVIQGDESLLETIPTAEWRQVRRSRAGERIVVAERQQIADLLPRLPAGVTAEAYDGDLEVVLSEWMQ